MRVPSLDTGLLAVVPQMQKALQQINRAAIQMPVPAPAPPPPGPSAVVEGHDSLGALANLARIVSVAGEGSSALQGLEIRLGDRLTGWVAENQQAINSEAKLDLGPEAAFVGLRFCLALPLASDGRVAGVLSLYGKEMFSAEQVHTLRNVLPHLAVMFLALEGRAEAPPSVSARQPLRVVASR